MAVNLGDVVFGLAGDTSAMRKAVQSMQAFGRQVDAVAKSQSAQARAAVAQMARQEAAARKAQAEWRRLHVELSRAGASTAFLSRQSSQFAKFQRTMTGGVLTAHQYARAQDYLRGRLHSSNRELKRLGTAANTAAIQGGHLHTMLRNLESASVLALGPLSGLGARIRSLGIILDRSTLKLALFLGGLTAGVVGFYKLTEAAIKARIAYDQIRGGLIQATGSIKAAHNEFLYLMDVSNKLGLGIQATATEYSRLSAAARGTALTMGDVRRVFLGVSKAAAVLHLNNEQVSSIFLALQQMISKGTVQAQELQIQFGQNLPGGFQLAARAMGMTTAKLRQLMKQGNLLSDVFLKKLAGELEKTFGPNVNKAVDTVRTAQNRLNNSVFKFSLAIDKSLGISESWKKTLNDIAGALNWLADHLRVVYAIMAVLGLLMAKRVITLMVQLIAVVYDLSKAFLALAAAQSLALATNPITLGILAAIVAIMALLAVIKSLDAAWKMIQEGAKAAAKFVESAWWGAVAVFGDIAVGIANVFVDAFNYVVKVAKKAAVGVVNAFGGSALKLFMNDKQKAAWDKFVQSAADKYFKPVGRFKFSASDATAAAAKASAASIAAQAAWKKAGEFAGKAFVNNFDEVLHKSLLAKGLHGALDYLKKAWSWVTKSNAQNYTLPEKLWKPGPHMSPTHKGGKGAQKLIDKMKESIKGLQEQLKGLAFIGKDVTKAWPQDFFDKLARSQERIKALSKLHTRLISAGVKPGSAYYKTAMALGVLEVKLKEQLKDKKAILDKTKQVYKDIVGPAKDYLQTQVALNLLLKQGLITQGQYNQKIREARIAFLQTQTDLISGLELGLRTWGQDVDTWAKFASQGVHTVLDDLQQAFSDFIDTGKFNWRKFLQAMLSDLAKLFAHKAIQLLASVFGSFLGIGSGAPSMGGGGGSGSFWSALFGAKGFVGFSKGGVTSIPTMFPMSNGRVGIMSEFGQQEAAMPLTRNSAGQLSVHAVGDQQKPAPQLHIHMHTIVQVGVESTVRAEFLNLMPAFKKVAKEAVIQGMKNAEPGFHVFSRGY